LLSGHENCFHPDADCLKKYGDKLFAVHLDDNFRNADTHLLPYDGTINWDSIKEKLMQCRNTRYISLEVDFNGKHPESIIYKDLPAQDFLAKAYAVTRKIAYDNEAYTGGDLRLLLFDGKKMMTLMRSLINSATADNHGIVMVGCATVRKTHKNMHRCSISVFCGGRLKT